MAVDGEFCGLKAVFRLFPALRTVSLMRMSSGQFRPEKPRALCLAIGIEYRYEIWSQYVSFYL